MDSSDLRSPSPLGMIHHHWASNMLTASLIDTAWIIIRIIAVDQAPQIDKVVRNKYGLRPSLT